MASTSFIKTPLLFNAAQIQKEIASIADKRVSDKVHSTGWEAIAILEDELEKGAYLSYVLNFFPSDKVAIQIERQPEKDIPTEDLQKRAQEFFCVYIPIGTEEAHLAGEDFPVGMKPGQCWFLSPLSSPSEQVLPSRRLRIDLQPCKWTEQFQELSDRFTPSAENVIFSPSLSQETLGKAIFHRVFGRFLGNLGTWF